MSKLLLIIFLHICLVSCGAITNFIQHRKPESYTRFSSSIFIDNFDDIRRVAIVARNGTSYDSFRGLKNEIISSIDTSYKIVSSPKNADVIIYVTVKQFTKLPQAAADKMTKYWSYLESSNVTNIKEIEKGSFAIAEKGFAFSDGNGIRSASEGSKDNSIIGKMSSNDFISGMILGGAAGFAINETLGASLIGGFLGGGISYAMQSMTAPVVYFTVADVQISKKIKYNIKYEEKYIHKQDDNGIRWHNHKTSVNRLNYRTKVYALVKTSMLGYDKGAQISVGKLGSAIAGLV